MTRSKPKRTIQHSGEQHPSLVPSMIQLPPVQIANTPPIHNNQNSKLWHRANARQLFNFMKMHVVKIRHRGTTISSHQESHYEVMQEYVKRNLAKVLSLKPESAGSDENQENTEQVINQKCNLKAIKNVQLPKLQPHDMIDLLKPKRSLKLKTEGSTLKSGERNSKKFLHLLNRNSQTKRVIHTNANISQTKKKKSLQVSPQSLKTIKIINPESISHEISPQSNPSSQKPRVSRWNLNFDAESYETDFNSMMRCKSNVK